MCHVTVTSTPALSCENEHGRWFRRTEQRCRRHFCYMRLSRVRSDGERIRNACERWPRYIDRREVVAQGRERNLKGQIGGQSTESPVLQNPCLQRPGSGSFGFWAGAGPSEALLSSCIPFQQLKKKGSDRGHPPNHVSC